MVVIKDTGDALERAVKRRVRVEGKYSNWKVGVGKFIIAWAAFPLNFSFWMMPIGIVMAMGITPGLWTKIRLREFDQWRKCL